MMKNLSITAKYIYKLMFICLLTGGAFYGFAASDDVGHIDDSPRSIGFELIDGLIVVKASYGGVSGHFVLDTGAPTSLINQKVRHSEFQLWSPKGSHKGAEVTIADFSFGMISKSSLDVWAMDLSFLEQQLDHDIDGIIGNDIWENHQVIINYANQEITFHHKGDAMSIHPDQYDIASVPWKELTDELRTITLQINGEEKYMAFDTGAGINVLHESEGNQQIDFGQAQMEHVVINQVPFITSDLSVLMEQAGKDAIDGIISPYSLKADIIILDFSNERVHVCWKKVSSS